MNVSSIPPQPASYYPSPMNSHTNQSVHSHHSHHSSKHSHSLKQSTTKHSHGSLTASPQKQREHKYSYASHNSHQSHSHQSHRSESHQSHSHQSHSHHSNKSRDPTSSKSQHHQHSKSKSNSKKMTKTKAKLNKMKNSKLDQFGKQNRQFLCLNDNDDVRSQISEQSIEYLGHIKDGKVKKQNISYSSNNHQHSDYIYNTTQRQESMTSINSLNSTSMTLNTTTTVSQLGGAQNHPLNMNLNPQNIYTQKSGASSNSSKSSSSASSSDISSGDSRSNSNDSRSRDDVEDDQQSQDTHQYDTRSITELTRDIDIDKEAENYENQHDNYAQAALSLQNNMDSLVIHDDHIMDHNSNPIQIQPGNDTDEINPNHRSHNMEDDDSADSNDDEEEEHREHRDHRNHRNQRIMKANQHSNTTSSSSKMRLNIIPPQNKMNPMPIKMKNVKSNNSFLSSEAGSIAAESSVLSPLSDHMSGHIINGHQIYGHKNHYNGHYIHGHHSAHSHHRKMDRIHPMKQKSPHGGYSYSNHSHHYHPHSHHSNHRGVKPRSGNRHRGLKNVC